MQHQQTDRKIEIEETIPTSIDSLWNAWTTNDGLQSWLIDNTDVELKIGGKFEIYFAMDVPDGSRGSEKCTILSYAPESMLSFSWNAPPTIPSLRKLGPCTWVVLNIERVDDSHTKLKLTHYGIKSDANDWDAYLAYFQSAWPQVFLALQKHFS